MNRPHQLEDWTPHGAEIQRRMLKMAGPGIRGRRSKGDRKLIGFRLETPQADLVTELAAAEGYKYVSDWVADVVKHRIRTTDLRNVQHQQELPISRIA